MKKMCDWLIVGAITIILNGEVFPEASADERLSHSTMGQIETWRIDEPNVTQPETMYPTFKKGDRIIIEAGGCVQHGGHDIPRRKVAMKIKHLIRRAALENVT